MNDTRDWAQMKQHTMTHLGCIQNALSWTATGHTSRITGYTLDASFNQLIFLLTVNLLSYVISRKRVSKIVIEITSLPKRQQKTNPRAPADSWALPRVSRLSQLVRGVQKRSEFGFPECQRRQKLLRRGPLGRELERGSRLAFSIQLISVYFLDIKVGQLTTTQSGFKERMETSHG